MISPPTLPGLPWGGIANWTATSNWTDAASLGASNKFQDNSAADPASAHSFQSIFADALAPTPADAAANASAAPAANDNDRPATASPQPNTDRSRENDTRPPHTTSSDATAAADSSARTHPAKPHAVNGHASKDANAGKPGAAKDTGVKGTLLPGNSPNATGASNSDTKPGNAANPHAPPAATDASTGQPPPAAPQTPPTLPPANQLAVTADAVIPAPAANQPAPPTTSARIAPQAATTLTDSTPPGTALALPGSASVPAATPSANPRSFADTAFALHITPSGGAASQNAPAVAAVPGQSSAAQSAKELANQPPLAPPAGDPAQAPLPVVPLDNAAAGAVLNFNAASRPRAAAALLSGPAGLGGNPAPWAAPAFNSVANPASGGAPAATPTTAAAAIPPDPAENAPQAVRTVRLQLAGEGDQVVDMRLVEHAGALSVNVRTSDGALARGLQDHLPELGARLAAEHYDTQAWVPATPASAAGGSPSGSSDQSGGGRSSSQGDPSSSDNGRNQQQPGGKQQPDDLWTQMTARTQRSAAAPASEQSSVLNFINHPIHT